MNGSDSSATDRKRPHHAHTTGAVVGVLLTIAAYKLFVFGTATPQQWAEGFLLDLGIGGTIWLVAQALQRAPHRGVRVVGHGLFWPAVALWFGMNFSFTYFFKDAAERHYSLLNVSLNEVVYFFRTLLPLTGWLWLLGLVGTVVLTARWSAPRLHPRAMGRPALGVLVLALAAFTTAWRDPEVPNPVMDVVRDVRERWNDRLVPETDGGATPSIALYDRSARPAGPLRTRFTKIVVVVMETMAFDTYRIELDSLPRDNVLHRIIPNAHRYDRYFTVNQDSRTAMLDMLGSRFIPYEAYDDATFPLYEQSSKQPNLAALLHAEGYETMYALGQVDQEQVVAELPWQRVLSLTPARIDTLKARGALCFHPYEFENSCEDKVLLPEIVDFLSGHEKAFVYQEMMWGHALEYNRASGKGNVRYVAEFVDSLWSELRRRHLDDQTLLVLTGDHGDKAEDRRHEAVNYQVPIYFYAPSFREQADSAMRTHLDFKDLLWHELEPTRPLPPPMPFVQVMGPTDSHLRYVVDRAGRLIELRTRGDRTYLAWASGPDAPDAAVHVRMYRDYRRWFESVVPKSVH